MHAELPAARILLSAAAGRLRRAHTALLDCQRYPFVWPLVLAAVQAVTPASASTPAASPARWPGAATLFGLFLLGRENSARASSRS